MMRRIALALLLASTSLVASPAGALSCAQPQPIDWEVRFPAVDAALIVEVTGVEEIADESYAGSLQISAVVRETLKGMSGRELTYTVPSLKPWGPYYGIGDEIAVIIENGTVTDGRQKICGPWFGPEELRQAAERYGSVVDPTPEPKPEPAPSPPVEPPESKPMPTEPQAQPNTPPVTTTRSLLTVVLELMRLILGILGLS